ncbi:MAG: hypothetical protein WC341_14075 [Bacteroidales bacterium]|jgi:hypothetical protein
MKIIRVVVLIVGLVFMMGACNSNSKQSTWSADQQKEWKSKCMKFMKDVNVEEKDAADFCDCMYEKTSKNYTPEEAQNITTEQQREIWSECDYTW